MLEAFGVEERIRGKSLSLESDLKTYKKYSNEIENELRKLIKDISVSEYLRGYSEK